MSEALAAAQHAQQLQRLKEEGNAAVKSKCVAASAPRLARSSRTCDQRALIHLTLLHLTVRSPAAAPRAHPPRRQHGVAVERYTAALALAPPPAVAAVLHGNRAAAHQVGEARR